MEGNQKREGSADDTGKSLLWDMFGLSSQYGSGWGEVEDKGEEEEDTFHSGHNGRHHHQHHDSSQTRHYPHQQQHAQDRHASPGGAAALAADRREIRQLPQFHGKNTRTNSFPNVDLERGPVRQAGFRDLAKSMHRSRDYAISLPTSTEHQDSMDHLQLVDDQEPAQQASQEAEYVEEIQYNIFNEPVRVTKKLSRSRRNVNNAPSSPTRNNHGRASSPRNSPHRQSHPRAEEKVGEQAPEHLKVPNLSQLSPPLQTGEMFTAIVIPHPVDKILAIIDSSPRNSPHRQSHPRAEEKVGEQAPEHLKVPNLSQLSPPLQTGRNVHGNRHSPPRRQNSGHHRSSRDRDHQMEEQKQPSLPSLLKNNDTTNQSKSSGEDEPLDALALLCAQYCETHPEETVKFVPGSQTVLPDSELFLPSMPDDLSVMTPDTASAVEYCETHPEETVKFVPGSQTVLPHSELLLPNMPDDLSVMTPDTCFGRGSMASTQLSRGQPSRRTNLTAISETSSGASSGRQRSMISHKIKEPVVPVQVTQPASNNNEAPAQNMESYLESSAPDLLTLREFVESFTAAGADAEAIDTVTLSLIHDNATSMSMALALFCLTTLWVLARKSDENKRKIIFEDSTFDAIIEAMEIYHERSAEIQTRACGVLWSLSMDPNDRKHVAQGGGCDAILNAMLIHMDDDALQVMALGALKVLSFDNIGKSTLRSRSKHGHVACCGSLSMDPNDRKHVAQGGGCDAILNAMLVHTNEDTLQVMALGALKVLSFDNIGKSTLRSRGTLSIVADIMQKHLRNPTIQSEGCVILGNLAVDNANQFVAPVTEKEVDAVIRGILAHPESLEVHEAACFTLMSL
eukprot:CAMPEP_0201987186 /NCGR_PEP_ID=MMETSP0904-20121228/91663_1 /ASSEMBLY_ACC=CAM_ASM_000553 /TAXON_ID=420261 /ORGANISM="Thalassiosira antarctica, Strain CCMP982" /LENGTH=849 /DNA_ID=CAMNT_0048541285 /DNA_START=201 /DNA_END=2749 /DNA_ORIENTATION=-